MIEAVIFDVDGTLIDSVEAHARAWTEAFARFGRPVDFAKVRHEIGKGGDQLMKVFLSETEIQKFGRALEKDRSEHFRREYLPSVKAFPKVRELFQRIAADRRQIVLASSAQGGELKTYKEKARIGDLVEEETSKDDAARSKPHPDIFEVALDQVGVPPGNAIVVGDAPWDAIAAGKAGLRVVGVLCGGFAEAELRAAGCLAIYRDPADLLDRYDDSPLAG